MLNSAQQWWTSWVRNRLGNFYFLGECLHALVFHIANGNCSISEVASQFTWSFQHSGAGTSHAAFCLVHRFGGDTKPLILHGACRILRGDTSHFALGLQCYGVKWGISCSHGFSLLKLPQRRCNILVLENRCWCGGSSCFCACCGSLLFAIVLW